MVDQVRTPEELWNEAAEEYRELNERFSVYRDAITPLLNLVEIRPGMRIVDLGCGVGVSTEEISSRLGPEGEIIGIDFSENMLSLATERVSLQRGCSISFLKRRAEDFSSALEEEFDLVCCHSAIWHFHWPAMIGEVNKALKRGGYFLYSLPEQHGPNFIGTKEWIARRLFYQRFFLTLRDVLEDYGVNLPYEKRAITEENAPPVVSPDEFARRAALENAGFKLLKMELHTISMPMDVHKDLCQLLPFRPRKIPPSILSEVLDRTVDLLKERYDDEVDPCPWVYFSLQKIKNGSDDEMINLKTGR